MVGCKRNFGVLIAGTTAPNFLACSDAGCGREVQLSQEVGALDLRLPAFCSCTTRAERRVLRRKGSGASTSVTPAESGRRVPISLAGYLDHFCHEPQLVAVRFVTTLERMTL